LEDQIKNLQIQVNSLQERIPDLEIKLENPKHILRSQNKAPDDIKIIPHQSQYLEAEYGLLFAKK
jgi:subtilisin-like proprotein convertase family protein